MLTVGPRNPLPQPPSSRYVASSPDGCEGPAGELLKDPKKRILSDDCRGVERAHFAKAIASQYSRWRPFRTGHQ